MRSPIHQLVPSFLNRKAGFQILIISFGWMGLLSCLTPSPSPPSVPNDKQEYEHRVRHFFDMGQWDSASFVYQKWWEHLPPDSQTLYLNIGNHYARTLLYHKKPDDAATIIQQIETHFSPSQDTDTLFFLQYLNNGIWLNQQKGNVRASDSMLNMVHEWVPDSAVMSFNLAEERLFSHHLFLQQLTLKNQFSVADSAYRNFLSRELDSLAGTFTYIDILTEFGKLQQRLNRPYEAVDAFQNGIALAQKYQLPPSLRLGHLYSQLAFAYYMVGSFKQTEKYYQKNFDLLQQFPQSPIKMAAAYAQLGMAAGAQQNSQLAHSFYQQSRNLYQEAQSQRGIAYTHTQEALIFELEEKYDHATTLLRRVNGIANTHPQAIDGQATAKQFANLGRMYQRGGKRDSSLYFLNLAFPYFQSKPQWYPGALIEIFLTKGKLFLEEKKHIIAWDNYQHALDTALFYYGASDMYSARSYWGLAQVSYEEGKIAQALSFIQQALPEFMDFQGDSVAISHVEAIPYPTLLLDLLILRGKVLAYRDADTLALKQSLSMFEVAQQLVDSLRTGIGFEKDKFSFIKKVHTLYEPALSTAFTLWEQTHHPQYLRSAFTFMEKSRGNVLLEGVQENKAIQYAQLDPALLEQEKSLKIQMGYWERRIFQYQQQHPQAENSPEFQSWLSKRFAIQQSYDSLKAALREKHPVYFQHKYDVSIPDMEMLQRETLQAQQGFVEYFSGKEHLYIFYLDRDTSYLRQIPLELPMHHLVKQYVQSLSTPPASQSTRAIRASSLPTIPYETIAHQLSQLLISPLSHDTLPRKLILVPDGILAYVPFDALLSKAVPDSLQDKFTFYPYLFLQHEISYAYSATLWEKMRKRARDPRHNSMLLVSQTFSQDSSDSRGEKAMAGTDSLRFDFLKYVNEEIRGIRKIFAGLSLKNRQADKATVLEKMDRYAALHFTTHGVIDDRESGYSYLALADAVPDTSSLGKLFVSDLYAQQIHAAMVVLSACNMGIGDLHRGEGIISMARGFAYAGAGSIVSTLWNVNDESTAFIMQRFYTHLAAGLPKDEALNLAKNDYLSSDKVGHDIRHPYFWAAYIPIGDMSPLKLQKATPWGLYGALGGILLLVLGIGSYVWKKRKTNKGHSLS